jgi:hypothetical protein
MRSQSSLLALFCTALFAAALALNTLHNDFPWYYHPDEPGKVEQIQEGRWNMHHPLLQLGGTRVAAHWLGASSGDEIARIGRALAAAFTAGAIVALTLLAFRWRGWPAAVLTGLVLLWHHQLFELAHYLKEDPSLLFGLSLALLALWLFDEAPTLARAACFGAACGIAVSAKYVGAMILLAAVAVLARHWQWSRTGAFLAAWIAAFSAINWPLFSEFATFQRSFHREVDLVVRGQGGTTQNVPHAEYWTIFRDNTTPVLWLLLAVFFAVRWRERHRLPLRAWILILAPILYTVALSLSPKTNDRYFLPASALFSLFAAVGASDLARIWPRPGVWAGAALLLVAAQFPSWSASRPGWLEYERAFRIDDNAQLIAFLQREVPPDAVLLKDNRIALPDPKRRKHAARLGIVPQKVVARRFAADLAPFDELAARGITHVIASESDYGKFYRRSIRPQQGEEEDFARRREFYDRLFAEAELLREWPRGTVIYLHPGIRIYRLPPPP